jgi:hypothetical protein
VRILDLNDSISFDAVDPEPGMLERFAFHGLHWISPDLG